MSQVYITAANYGNSWNRGDFSAALAIPAYPILPSVMTTSVRDGLIAIQTSDNTLRYLSNGTWFSASGGGGGSGTVTAITAGTGLTGGTITTSGTIALSIANPNPGTYTNATVTIDSFGRVTAASNGTTGTGTVSSVGLTSSDITVGGTSPITTSGTFTLTLPTINTNVGTWNTLTVNAKGQVTAGSNVSYQPQLSGTGFVKITGTTISYDNSTYYLASNPSGYTANTGTVTSVAVSAGTGISVTGSPITSLGTITVVNTAPDQVVALTAGTGISTSGTYPNFTITNTSPSSGGTVTSITAGTGLSGGTITGSGTIAVNTSQNIITLSNLTTNGFIKTTGGTGALAIDTSTYITGNQSITLSGDVSGTGTTAITTTIGTSKVSTSMIQANAVNYNKIQQLAASTLLGNPTGSTANVSEITLGTGLAFSGTTLVATGTGGTVTSVTSATADATVTNTTTTPVITIASAPKWTTARILAGNSVDGSANVAFTNKFIVQGTTDTGLTGPQFLGALGTGIVKNTTTTGVLSIAVAADFPTLNQSTTGSAATLTTARTINGTSFNGSANITVTAAAGTLTGTALNTTVVSSSLTSVGTISTGTWNGTAVGVGFGGTGVSLTATGGTGQYLKQTTTGGTITVGTISVSDVPTLNQNTTGSAATLTTGRSINGVIFNGSANILLDFTINNQTVTSYTFVASDDQQPVTFSNSSAITATINTGVFAVGAVLIGIQTGAGKLTFAAGAGITLNSFAGNKSAAGQYVGVSAVQVALNSWILLGNLIA